MALTRNTQYSDITDAPNSSPPRDDVEPSIFGRFSPHKSSPLDFLGSMITSPITSVLGNIGGDIVGGLFQKRGSDQAYQRLQQANANAQKYFDKMYGEQQAMTDPYVLGNLGMYQQGTDYAQNLLRDVQAGKLPGFMNTMYDNLMRQKTIAGQGTGNPLYGSTTGEQTRSMAAQNMAGQAQQYAPSLLMQMFGMGAPMQQAGFGSIGNYYGSKANAELAAGGAGAQAAMNTGNIFGNMANTIGGIPQDYQSAVFSQRIMDQMPQLFNQSVRNNPGLAY